MVPRLNWTPSASRPHQIRDPSTREPCGDGTRSVLTKEKQLGSQVQL